MKPKAFLIALIGAELPPFSPGPGTLFREQTAAAEPGEEREEGRDFKGHLLGCASDGDGLVLINSS